MQERLCRSCINFCLHFCGYAIPPDGVWDTFRRKEEAPKGGDDAVQGEGVPLGSVEHVPG